MRRRRKPDWLVALVMLVGGGIPTAATAALLATSWGAILAGFVVFWPCAFVAGVIFTRNDVE